jgi:hypothetical protein
MEWWEFFFTMLILTPIVVLWIGTMVDIFGRSDLSGLLKVGWLLGIFILPLLGPLLYILLRPRPAPGERIGPMEGMWSTDPNRPNRVT